MLRWKASSAHSRPNWFSTGNTALARNRWLRSASIFKYSTTGRGDMPAWETFPQRHLRGNTSVGKEPLDKHMVSTIEDRPQPLGSYFSAKAGQWALSYIYRPVQSTLKIDSQNFDLTCHMCRIEETLIFGNWICGYKGKRLTFLEID